MLNSQCARILSHLRSRRNLTPLQALELFGCFRLAARIHELRSRGIAVECRLVEKNGKRLAQYSLV